MNSTATRRLLDEAIVWDNTFPFGPSCGSREVHAETLRRMHAVGYTCVSLTTASDNDDMPLAMRKIAQDNAFFRSNADRYLQAHSVADIERAQRESKLAVVYTFQGTLPFEREVGLVEVFYRLGVRQALMAYNQRNHVGDGCHERSDAGLSRFGVRVVEEMNRVGMVVDCTHCSYRTTMDVFEVARAPVVFSHSNARALVDHERNIRDDQAVACARTGGVVGVNGASLFLGDDQASAQSMFRHIDHFVQLIGADHVGIGLDYVSDTAPLMSIVRGNAQKYPADSGYASDPVFAGPEIIPELAELMLRRGYAEPEVRGVLGGNWLRVARETWK